MNADAPERPVYPIVANPQLRIEAVDPARLQRWLRDRTLDACLAQFEEDGYIIFHDVLTPGEISEIKSALTPHFSHFGRNDFEGFRTNRVYGLLQKSPRVFGDLVAHPLPLAFAEYQLGETCLVTVYQAVNLHPGETVQGWHYDEGALPIPLPRPAYFVSTFWSIEDTTDVNGATEIIPGSHRWTSQDMAERMTQEMRADPGPRADVIQATMPAGSLLITKGTLWHRGGANHSKGTRLIITPQYCAGWCRQMENMMASVSREVTATLPKRTRELMGYSIHGGVTGYVDARHPDRLLGL